MFLQKDLRENIILEKLLLLPSGFLLGKEHQGQASAPLLPATPASALSPPTSTTSASSTHAKTGSKDSSTQTDKITELFWPSMASLPSRGRLSTAPSNSPVLKHPAAKGTVEKQGMWPLSLPCLERSGSPVNPRVQWWSSPQVVCSLLHGTKVYPQGIGRTDIRSNLREEGFAHGLRDNPSVKVAVTEVGGTCSHLGRQEMGGVRSAAGFLLSFYSVQNPKTPSSLGAASSHCALRTKRFA